MTHLIAVYQPNFYLLSYTVSLLVDMGGLLCVKRKKRKIYDNKLRGEMPFSIKKKGLLGISQSFCKDISTVKFIIFPFLSEKCQKHGGFHILR